MDTHDKYWPGISVIIGLLGMLAGCRCLVVDQHAQSILSETRQAKMNSSQAAFLLGMDKIANNETTGGLAYLAHAIRTHPDHNHTAAATRIGNLLLQRTFALPLPETGQPGEAASSDAFSLDGSKTFSSPGEYLEAGAKRISDAPTGRQLTETMLHGEEVLSAIFSPDGSKILTTSGNRLDSGWVRVWNAATGEPLTNPLQHGEEVKSAVFSPDGTKILTASSVNFVALSTLRIWDAVTGELLSKTLQQGKQVHSAVFSQGGTKILTASGNNHKYSHSSYLLDPGSAQVWDAATDSPLTGPMQHGRSLRSAVFSPNGTKIVTASQDKTACIWDVATGKTLTRSLQHGEGVLSAAFSPDGTKIVTASWDKTAQVWDTATGKPLTEPMQHGGCVLSAVFSPDGTKVVTASRDKTARIWDATTGKSLTIPLRHGGDVNSAVFSPDGAEILTASWDKTAQVWDAITGRPLTDQFQHWGEVHSAVFSLDGSEILTASEDKTARIWPIAPPSTVPVPDWLAPLAEAIAGYRVNDQGVLEPIPTSQLLQFRQRFQNATDKDPYSQIARWFFADPATRPTSPYQMDATEK